MKDLYNRTKKIGPLFDFNKKPIKNLKLFKLVAIIGSRFSLIGKKLQIKKENMKKIKAPFILLPNHSNFFDYYVIICAMFPKSLSWCAGVEGFLKNEFGLRHIGGFPKRRFLNDNISMVKNIRYELEKLKQSVILFPEGHYSMDGRLANIPVSFAKVLKIINAPVVTIKMEGNFIAQPFWNCRKTRNTRLRATMTGLYTPEELQTASVEEIHANIVAHLQVDDLRYQKENHIQIRYRKNAEGLERLLYKCPHCQREFEMESEGNELFCKACNKRWTLTPLNELVAREGETLFSHVGDWLAWQRNEVAKELKQGNYKIEGEVDVDWLPNSKGFIPLGKGQLVHTIDGYQIQFNRLGTPMEIVRHSIDTYSIHLELRYTYDRDALDVAAQDSSYYVYFVNKGKGYATKLKLGVDEAHRIAMSHSVDRVKR